MLRECFPPLGNRPRASAQKCSPGRTLRSRRRDADLVAAGYRVVRFTWRQITGEPEAVVARLAELLAQAGGAVPVTPGRAAAGGHR